MLLLFCVGWVFTFKPASHLFTELGPFELAQTLFMVASCFIWGKLAVSEKQQPSIDVGIDYKIASFFTVLSFVVVGRETSFLSVYGASETLESGLMVVTTILVVPAFGYLCFSWSINFGRSCQQFRVFMGTSSFFWAIAAFIFVLFGDFFEKKFLPIQSNLVWEETFELMGYLAIFVAAMIAKGDSLSVSQTAETDVVPT